MNYIWQTGRRMKLMHIERHDATGRQLMTPLCRSKARFNRSVNAPFTLGRPVCKQCLAMLPGLKLGFLHAWYYQSLQHNH